MEVLRQVGGLLVGIALSYGPVVGLMTLLNLRDRRQSRLHGSVLTQFGSLALRGRVAIQTRCAVLSPRSLVTVDMRACSRDEIWEAVGRLSQSLPPRVRLVVDGTLDPQLPATFTVEATRPLPLRHPSRLSVATS